MRCLYESAAVACKQLRLYRHDSPQPLISRAHNHRKGDDGRWYVLAGAEWPPYGHGLFFADSDPFHEGSIRIGAILYRGLGRAAGPGLTKPAAKPLLMQRHWRWREIVQESDGEALVECVATAASAVHSSLGVPITLAVCAGKVDANAGVDPNDAIASWDRMVYSMNRRGELSEVHRSTDGGILNSLAGLGDVEELAAGLRSYAPDDWVWTEFSCSLHLQPAVPEQTTGKPKSKRKVDPSLRLVTTHELYESMLAPFEGWLFE